VNGRVTRGHRRARLQRQQFLRQLQGQGVRREVPPPGRKGPSSAVAIVISDPHGTRVYASSRFVASKRILPWTSTLLASGTARLGTKQLPRKGRDQDRDVLRPVQVASEPSRSAASSTPEPWLSLLAEYSPIRYERQTSDPAHRNISGTPSLPFSISAHRIKRSSGWESTRAGQRGTTSGLGLRRLRHRPHDGPDPRRPY